MQQVNHGADALAIRRAYVQVGQRRVHYRQCGVGPPALLIHASPTHSGMLLPELRYLGRFYTCYAFDSAGFGLSQPLPLASMTLADLADATAANMQALGLPACPVYGSHTGAAIALELALRHPQRVTGIALDGLAVFDDDECAAMIDASRTRGTIGSSLESYVEDLPVDELGGHFSRVWTRFRDQSMWFPWFRREPGQLNAYDLAPPASTHNWCMMYYYAAAGCGPAFHAALTYGSRSRRALAALGVPAVFTASDTDMMRQHLERMPALRAGQVIEPFGSAAGDNKLALVARHFVRFGSPHPAPPPLRELVAGDTLACQFVDLPHGQIHVRHAGRRALPALLLLHDAPGSAAALETLIGQLSVHFFVVAPDLPGCGESAPLTAGAPLMAQYVDAMLALTDTLVLARPLVYGVGFGSSLALALQERAPAAVRAVLLRGVLLPDAGQRADLAANYTPAIDIAADGSHWYRTWLMLRDSLTYWPWYQRRHRNTRDALADSSAQRLHDWTFDVMKQPASYGHLIGAALAHDAAAALAAAGVPVLLCSDAAQPLFAYDAEARRLAPAAALVAPGGAHARALADVLSLLDNRPGL